jgi:hypothetical protein
VHDVAVPESAFGARLDLEAVVERAAGEFQVTRRAMVTRPLT